MVAYAPINLTASTTLNETHAGAIIVLNAAAGLTVTLPAAVGSGRIYEMIVGTTVTSNDIIVQVANATDVMAGTATNAQDGGNTAVMFETAAASDTITMDGSTTGGIKGDRITLQDVSSGLWAVKVLGAATGTEATPFSAAVS